MTTARSWLRATAVVLALFALGHTLGTASPKVMRGAPEAALFAAMQSFQFPMMGFTRSYWDFYRGFAITIGMLQAALAVFAWQTGTLAARDPVGAKPFAFTVLATCIGFTVLSALFFFTVPIVMAGVASLTAAIAVWRLAGAGTPPRMGSG
jgi:hypothetical protein